MQFSPLAARGSKTHNTLIRVDRSQYTTSECGFTRALFADDPEGFGFTYREADIVNGGATIEAFIESGDFEQRVSHSLTPGPQVDHPAGSPGARQRVSLRDVA